MGHLGLEFKHNFDPNTIVEKKEEKKEDGGGDSAGEGAEPKPTPPGRDDKDDEHSDKDLEAQANGTANDLDFKDVPDNFEDS